MKDDPLKIEAVTIPLASPTPPRSGGGVELFQKAALIGLIPPTILDHEMFDFVKF